MRGRPRKYDIYDPPVRVTVYVPASLRFKIPDDVVLTDLFTNFIANFLNDSKKIELKELEKKEMNLKEQLAIVQSQILKLRREIEQSEKLKEEIEKKELYAIWQFWNILKQGVKINRLPFTGNKYPETILGIKFNYDAVEKALKSKEIISYSIETFEQAIQLAKQYNVNYIGRGQNEESEFNKFKNFYEEYKRKVKI
ncbi:MAG: hypothetical protein RXO36_05880 [Candidatus Nanopusillus acidilobi]|jgi:hypothetical protein